MLDVVFPFFLSLLGFFVCLGLVVWVFFNVLLFIYVGIGFCLVWCVLVGFFFNSSDFVGRKLCIDYFKKAFWWAASGLQELMQLLFSSE